MSQAQLGTIAKQRHTNNATTFGRLAELGGLFESAIPPKAWPDKEDHSSPIPVRAKRALSRKRPTTSSLARLGLDSVLKKTLLAHCRVREGAHGVHQQ